MNKYYAQVVDNIVMNVIEGDPTGRFDPKIKWHECDITTKIGDVFVPDDASFETVHSLEDEKKATLELVNLVYRTLFDKLTSEYDEREIGTWFIQMSEALDYYINGEKADIQFLAQVSKKRHIPLEILTKRVLGHTTVFRKMTGAITGDRQYFEDVVLGCQSIKELYRIRRDIQKWLEEGSKIAL